MTIHLVILTGMTNLSQFTYKYIRLTERVLVLVKVPLLAIFQFSYSYCNKLVI